MTSFGDEILKRFYVIDTSEKLKALSDPLRMRIIMILQRQEATGMQLAKELELPPSRVHYHLKELEVSGFVVLVRTSEKNGILQKFYEAAAVNYVVSEELLPSIETSTEFNQELVITHLKSAMSRVYETPASSFQFSNQTPLVVSSGEVRADKAQLRNWMNRYRQLMDELNQLDAPDMSETEGDEDVFFWLNVGFMTNVVQFKATEPDDEGDYDMIQWDSDKEIPYAKKRRDSDA